MFLTTCGPPNADSHKSTCPVTHDCAFFSITSSHRQKPAMDTSKVVEMLEKVKEAVTVQGSMGNCRTADDVRKAGVAQLRAEPLLWAAYCRGWADQTTDLVSSLGSSTARSPATTPTPKPPRPSTRHRVLTTKAMGSGCATPAISAAPAVRTTPTTRGAKQSTTPPR
jgi:hypothetical protein